MKETTKTSANKKKASKRGKETRELKAYVPRSHESAGRSASGKASGSSAKKDARSAAAKKSPAKNASAAAEKRNDHTDEIVGIVFIAAGIVMGILTYTGTAAIFKSVVGVFFGLMGVVQYAAPVLLAALGFALIFVPRRQFGSGMIISCIGAVFFISCVIHLFASPVGERGFSDYVLGAYDLGQQGHGGGLLASVPAYGLSKLISAPGAIVAFIALALILVLIATNVSIRSAGKKIAAKVDAMEDRRKARLINERVGEDYPDTKHGWRRRREDELMGSADEYGDQLMLGETDQFDMNGKKSRRPRTKNEKPAADTGFGVTEPAAKGAAGLSFLPTSGQLPMDRGNRAELKPTRVKQEPIASAAFEPAVTAPVRDYDPFETIEIIPDNITGETVPAAYEPPLGSTEPVKAAAKPAASPKKPQKAAENTEESDPSDELIEPPETAVYQKPPITLLRQPDRSEAIANDSPSDKAKLLEETLASFNITAKVTNIAVGPVITRFEIQPAPGTRVNRITALSNDIALALAAPRVRIEAPIPGKAAVGIEIPNKDTAMVRLREVIDTREFASASSPLTFALGKDIAGKPVYANLEKMPHMLIAGATGSGKSVCINSIILSTIYKATPDDVRMILIDPKVVELSIFAPVPHLYCPVVTDPKKAAGVLKWACNEMDQRYNKMSKVNARDLARYNSLQQDPADMMPRLMIIIDELADLMIVSAKDVEESIARLAQLGRACGIHLIVATQRPSVDVITGLIKTNIPSRIAFAVASAIDSRVILDGSGAEKLLGHGDMLFHPNGAAKPIRAQGAYVSDEEVENIMQFFIDHQVEVPQNVSVLDSIPDLTAPTGQGNGKQEDDLLPDAVRIVMDSGSASISMIQRRLRVGYARAARLVDIMEQMKIVSGFDGSKPRKVLIDEAGYAELFGGGYSPAPAPAPVPDEEY